MSTEDFFTFWRKEIKDTYLEPNSNMPIACGLLAVAFAKTLRDEGRNSDVICFYRSDYNEALTPAPYPHLSWYGHVVAVSDGVVFDPALKTPTAIDTYKQEMFPGQDVFFRHMDPVVSKENSYIDLALLTTELPGRGGIGREEPTGQKSRIM